MNLFLFFCSREAHNLFEVQHNECSTRGENYLFPIHLCAAFVCLQLSPPPQYIEERLTLYAKLKAEHNALMAERAAKDSKPIKVTLPDGKVVDAESWKTTPYQVACGIRSV